MTYKVIKAPANRRSSYQGAVYLSPVMVSDILGEPEQIDPDGKTQGELWFKSSRGHKICLYDYRERPGFWDDENERCIHIGYPEPHPVVADFRRWLEGQQLK